MWSVTEQFFLKHACSTGWYSSWRSSMRQWANLIYCWQQSTASKCENLADGSPYSLCCIKFKESVKILTDFCLVSSRLISAWKFYWFNDFHVFIITPKREWKKNQTLNAFGWSLFAFSFRIVTGLYCFPILKNPELSKIYFSIVSPS